MEEYIDFRITDRISACCTDFIVFFGVAKIKLSVVIDYAVPLVIMLALGGVIVFLTVYYFGPRMNKDSWFERSIFVYGYSTGVFAIGMLLLRIVDPNGESATLPDTGFAESIQTLNELFAWSVGPYMMMSGKGLWFGLGMLAVVVVSIAGTISRLISAARSTTGALIDLFTIETHSIYILKTQERRIHP